MNGRPNELIVTGVGGESEGECPVSEILPDIRPEWHSVFESVATAQGFCKMHCCGPHDGLAVAWQPGAQPLEVQIHRPFAVVYPPQFLIAFCKVILNEIPSKVPLETCAHSLVCFG